MNNLENFSTRLPKGTKKKLKEVAKKEGYIIQALVSKIFEQWLAERENKTK